MEHLDNTRNPIQIVSKMIAVLGVIFTPLFSALIRYYGSTMILFFVIVYAYAGYPLLLILVSRFVKHEVRRMQGA